MLASRLQVDLQFDAWHVWRKKCLIISDHDDAHGPKVDPEVDITDLYLFAAPGKIGRSVLIMNVYPLAPAQGANFATDVIYEVLVDTNDDAAPDVAFRTTFADGDNGQIATMRRAVGEAAAFEATKAKSSLTVRRFH